MSGIGQVGGQQPQQVQQSSGFLGKIGNFFTAIGRGIASVATSAWSGLKSIFSRQATVVEPPQTGRVQTHRQEEPPMSPRERELGEKALTAHQRGHMTPGELRTAKQDMHDLLSTELRDKDFSNENAKATILRSDSKASKMMKVFCNTVGNAFLRDLASPVLTSVKEHGSLEINPHRFPPEMDETERDETIQANQDKLKTLYRGIMNGIIGDGGTGATKVPQEICDLCRSVYDDVLKATGDPKTARSAVVGTLMLRFVSPALVSPGSIGGDPKLGEDLTMDQRKSLVTLSKMFQNQANDVTFKEPFMQPFNELLGEFKEDMESFLQGVVGRGSTEGVVDEPIWEDRPYAKPESLDALLTSENPSLHSDFRAHCEKRFVTESYDFCRAVNEFKKAPTKEKAMEIMQQFVNTSSPQEINIDSTERTQLSTALESLENGDEGLKDVFDDVYGTIRDLLDDNNEYDKFIATIESQNRD